MATLEAVVNVRDNASTKFTTMRASARRFEVQLESIDRQLTKIAAKLTALTSKKWTIQLDYDRNNLARALNSGGGGLNPNVGFFGTQLAARPNPGGYRSDGFVSGDPQDEGGFGTRIRLRDEKGRDTRRRFFSGIGGLGSGGGGIRFLTRGIIPAAMQIGGALGSTIGEQLGTSIGNLAAASKVAKAGAMLGRAGAVAGGGLGSVAGAAAVIVPIVAALGQGLAILGNMIMSLGVPIMSIVPALTAFGGALGFVGLPMFYLFSKTKELVDQKEQLREQLKQLTPGTEAYKKKLEELNEVQEKLNKMGTEQVWERATKLMEKVKEAVFSPANTKLMIDTFDNILLSLTKMIPLVAKSVGEFTTIFRDLFAELSEYTNTSEFRDWWSRTFGPGTQNLVETLGRGIGYLVKLFGELTAVIAPVAVVLFDKLNNWMSSLSDRLSSGETDLQSWLTKMLDPFLTLVSTLSMMIKNLANFVARPKIIEYTERFLNWLNQAWPRFLNWLYELVDMYGEDVISFLKWLGEAIKLVWSTLEAAYAFIQPFLSMALSISTELIKIGQDVAYFFRDAFGWVYDLIGGIRELINWIKGIGNALRDIPILGNFFSGGEGGGDDRHWFTKFGIGALKKLPGVGGYFEVMDAISQSRQVDQNSGGGDTYVVNGDIHEWQGRELEAVKAAARRRAANHGNSPYSPSGAGKFAYNP